MHTRAQSLGVENSAFIFDLKTLLIDPYSSHADARISTVTLSGLDKIAKINKGAVAVVSDNEIARITNILGPTSESLNLVGCHSGEEKIKGYGYRCDSRIAEIERLRDQVDEITGVFSPVCVEHRKLSIIVNFDTAPDLRGMIYEKLSVICASTNGEIQLVEGPSFWEIKSSKHNKGLATSSLLKLPSFYQKAPYFFGADLSAEAAYLAINLAGGYSIHVGDKNASSRANFFLENSTTLKHWLRSICLTNQVRSPTKPAKNKKPIAA